MGTITAQTIVDRAARVLEDVTHVRWPEIELLDWLNDGQNAIVLRTPDANAITTEIRLSGGTRQTIPVSGTRLIEIMRNVPHAGYNQSSRAIRKTQRRFMDAQNPDWHSDTADYVVKHYMWEPENPKVFYVYPPQPGAGRYVELVYSAPPAPIGLDNPIGLDDVYSGALLDYILFRAYSKDADYTENKVNADFYYKAFEAAIARKESGDQQVEPKTLPV